MNRSSRLVLGILTVCTVASVLFYRCSPEPVSGGGTEGGNVVSGVFIEDGRGVSAKVFLLPSDYNPGAVDQNNSVFTSVAASNGSYSFYHVPQGSYSIEAIDSVNGKRSLITGVAVSGADIQIPDDTLRAPGVLMVFLPTNVDTASGYFYLPGTTIFARFTGTTRSAVVSAPSATPLPPICYATLSNSTAIVLRYNVEVVTGDTTVVTNSGWKYARRICLNTSATGADVSQDVTGFPIVIRLTKENFDFAQTNHDGSDIRFSRSDTIRLPYEIERWDAANQRAEIWVKVDTIYGNDSTQILTMYWGNAAAGNNSNGASVFDTVLGFQGVWHLGDTRFDTVHDATSNQFHGVSPDTACPSITDGVVGMCRAFDGVDDYITMPNTADGKLNFTQDGHYMVSAWVFVDYFSAIPQLVVSKGYEQYYLWAADYSDQSPFWEFYEFDENTNWECTRSQATGGRWVLLTGVRQGENQFLYCNGILVDGIKDTSSWGIQRNASFDLSIGGFLEEIYDPSYEGYCFFRGSIDEVRVESTARNPDWVRLCYMNQRPDDRLVVFR